ncbi:hypothetical protein BN7_6038 [Wickerhamomyces ciferrii]|uniref:Uncharacterized protein n=1 Tax=Wickerhamomyces ciferrii (strain ATCC 14091 / BCRC 22168 / CBS 111 / JCM 3599 / NBRC 0793 / NRRL Y-1031 F-60-10) TaxID=1206466 RepID=K0KYC3_WICCF|nr:uncharacterized protein BN7_6038 [Wickerhamomyces ciferrii]CCH46444.1 hypothetical protein BN7_6038 [Wickerhamomyces ciferrii]
MGVIEGSNGAMDNDIKDLKESPPFQRRGIPGVNSDAYHFGYLDDQMVNYRSKPPVHTKYDSLLETLYIFGALLFITLILTGFWFGCREYQYSLKRKKRLQSSGSDWTSRSQISIDDITGRINNAEMIQGQTNPAYPTLQQNNTSLINHQNILSTGRRFSHTQEEMENRDITLGDTFEGDLPDNENLDLSCSPLHVVQNSITYSLNSLENLLPEHDLLKSSNLNKRIYSISELYYLKPTEHNGQPIMEDPRSLNLRKAIELSIPYQHVSFHSPWTAEKTIKEIEEISVHEGPSPILDNATKGIAILRFIAIIANSHTLNNPNIFLPSLNNAIEELIDTGKIFSLLLRTNAYNFRSLVETMLQYCYAHWVMHYEQNGSFIRTQFAKWKINSPIIMPHYVIVRYLINLQIASLSSAQTLGSEILQNFQIKILILLKVFFNNDDCNDLSGFIPILTQAIDFTEDFSSQKLFYELIYIMLKRHSKCCLENQLKDYELDLKRTVQNGFWIKNHGDIRLMATKIHMVILECQPSAMS